MSCKSSSSRIVHLYETSDIMKYLLQRLSSQISRSDYIIKKSNLNDPAGGI